MTSFAEQLISGDIYATIQLDTVLFKDGPTTIENFDFEIKTDDFLEQGLCPF